MGKKVYIVTDGEYSDYSIEGVFSTLEKAETCQRLYGYDNIEEYELDEELKIEKKIWEVQLPLSGVMETKCDCVSGQSFYEKKINCFRYGEWCGDTYMRFIVEATWSDEAIKIASEKFALVKTFPYLFPKLKEKYKKNAGDILDYGEYPWYNYKTKEIVNL